MLPKGNRGLCLFAMGLAFFVLCLLICGMQRFSSLHIMLS